MATMMSKHPNLQSIFKDEDEFLCSPCETTNRSGDPGETGNTAGTVAAAGKLHNKPPPEHYLTHFPKRPGCETRKLAKQTKKRCPRLQPEQHGSAKPTKFGDLITADHVIFNARDESHDKRRVLLTVYDRATSWIEAIPAPTKSTATTTLGLKDFAGTT